MNNNIYELRIYTVNPKDLHKLLKLWEYEGKPIIDKYMKCIGIWNSESGTLNKIFHLYYWDNYNLRETARDSFYKDINAKKYVKKVKTFYQKQESYILSSVDFLNIQIK